MNPPTLPHTPGSPHTPSRRRNRRSTAIGVTAGLLGGGAIGLLVAMPSFSSAASEATTTPTTELVVNDDTATDDTATDDTATDDTATDDTATDTPDAPDAPPSDADRVANATARIRSELQNLVDDGTITAAQADAVAADLPASLPEHGPWGPGGPGGRHRHPGFDGEVLAGLLGIDVETLRSDLRSGQTVGEIAAAQGVDVQTVIDSLVAEAEAHLDLSVESGRLTQDEADARPR
jgi:hypothetical protein